MGFDAGVLIMVIRDGFSLRQHEHDPVTGDAGGCVFQRVAADHASERIDLPVKHLKQFGQHKKEKCNHQVYVAGVAGGEKSLQSPGSAWGKAKPTQP